MTTGEEEEVGTGNGVLVHILEQMLEADETISARAVARKHPKLKHASSFTRNYGRTSLLAKYQADQKRFRMMRGRLPKRSNDQIAAEISLKDARITELERQVEILRVSHIAMIRAVGELGGISKLLKLYDGYRGVKNELDRLGLLTHSEMISIQRC